MLSTTCTWTQEWSDISEPLRGELGHVPPGPHALVGVDGLEELLELAVAPRRRVDVGLGDGLGGRAAAGVGAPRAGSVGLGPPFLLACFLAMA